VVVSTLLQAGGGGEAHLSFASRVRWGGAAPATTSTYRSRLPIDGCVLCQPPAPPVVHVSRSMEVCCAVPATTSTPRSHLAFDGVCAAPVTSSRCSHLVFNVIVPATTSTHCLHLAFDGGRPASSTPSRSRIVFDGGGLPLHTLYFAARVR